MNKKLEDVIMEVIGEKSIPLSFKGDLRRLSDELGSNRKSADDIEEILSCHPLMRSRIGSIVSIDAAQVFDKFIKDLTI